MPPVTVPLHAPDLAPGEWIQGPEISIRQSRGAVVLVEFWESTCINCLRTLPYLKAWHDRYTDRGLVMLGVHTPEFEFTAEPRVVAEAVRAEGITWPVLLDRDQATWQRFANHYWPSRYLIDARGYLRYEHFGEGAYGDTEDWIQRLLREAGGPMPMPPMPPVLEPVRGEDRPGAVCYPATREIHAGYHRGRLWASEGYRPGEEVLHEKRTDGPAPPGTFTARGRWLHEAESLESRGEVSEVELVCEAAGVNAVLEPGGELEIEVDGAPVVDEERGADVVLRAGRTFAVWDRPRMVRLIGGGRFRRRRLTLRFHRPGLRLYAFSFTSCVTA